MLLKESTSRIIIHILLGICVLRIILFWVDFFQFAINFDNPLIPKEILNYKFKFDLFFTIFLILPIVPLLYYLSKKRFFIGLSLVSVFLIILPPWIGPFISEIFNTIY
jgi:hypothetical protein